MKIFLPLVKKNFQPKDYSFSGYSIHHRSKFFSLINVSPGPTAIDEEVISKISQELSCDDNSPFLFGNTPLEMSHRSPEFKKILNGVNFKIRSFMEIPNDFEIIWTQGGGHGQFSAIPLNMKKLKRNTFGCYAVTGTWSSRAYEESKKFIKSENINTNYYKNFNYNLQYDSLPEKINVPNDADYLYVCSNETVNGVEYKKNFIEYPKKKDLGQTKLFVDMSSDFLMKKVDWANIDCAFACSSKNMGVAGLNILIIKKEILYGFDEVPTDNNFVPCTLDWKTYYDTNSLYNTPSVFNFYLLNHIMDNYMHNTENIDKMEAYNNEKARLLYDYIDNSSMFHCSISNIKYRSNINIPFIVGDGNENIRNKFLEHCSNHNIVGLRTQTPFSYKSLGLIEPLRISLYNGISIKQVNYIIDVMKHFI